MNFDVRNDMPGVSDVGRKLFSLVGTVFVLFSLDLFLFLVQN